MRKQIGLAVFAALLFATLGAVNNIKWSQISVSTKHGNGTYGQSSDGTGTSGNLAKYDANGNLTDGSGVFQTNGVNNAAQGFLSLNAGANITLTNASAGNVTIASTGGGGGPTLTAPVSASWTAFNTTGMVLAPTYSSSRFQWATAASATDNLQGVAIALPSVPYTRIFRVWPMLSRSFSLGAVGWADGTVGTPGKFATCGITLNTPGSGGGVSLPGTVDTSNWTNQTTFNSAITKATGITNGMHMSDGEPVWFRIADDNTHWTCDVSWDGSNWLNLFSENRNTFLTATQLVAVTNANSGGGAVSNYMIFDSYQ